MDLLLPTWLDLAGWAGVAVAAAALVGWGRLVTAGRAPPEMALVAGWGLAALVLTLWGVATPWSLRPLAAIIVAGGIVVLFLPRWRLTRAGWRGVARIVVVALPLLAVMASARPSEPDTFLNLLPNAVYLHDHAVFPAAGRAIDHSYLPAAPYNLQFVAFLAGQVTPHFPANALIGFNLVLLLAAGLMLARLAGGGEDENAPPSWSMAALGLLLATAFNPGFVPRFHLSGYDETPVMVLTACAGLYALKMLRRVETGTATGEAAIVFALALAALVNVKQDSIAIVAALLVTTAWLGRASRAGGRALGMVALAALPALVLYLAWRWFVLAHIPAGELQTLPPSAWQPGALPLILWRMVGIIAHEPFFYLVLAATFAAGGWRYQRRGSRDLATRAVALLGGTYILYSAALVLAYVAFFPPAMGRDAHSYFRYSTHLALLMMVALVLLARAEARERQFRLAGRAGGAVPILLVATMLAAPLVFLPFLRFDLEPPALRVWRLARLAAPHLDPQGRVALILPDDNGSVAPMLETAFQAASPRRPGVDFAVEPRLGPATLAALAARGYRVAILSCAPAGFGLAPKGTAALLTRADGTWRASRIWRYPPPRPGAHWSHELATQPLCLD